MEEGMMLKATRTWRRTFTLRYNRKWETAKKQKRIPKGVEELGECGGWGRGRKRREVVDWMQPGELAIGGVGEGTG